MNVLFKKLLFLLVCVASVNVYGASQQDSNGEYPVTPTFSDDDFFKRAAPSDSDCDGLDDLKLIGVGDFDDQNHTGKQEDVVEKGAKQFTKTPKPQSYLKSADKVLASVETGIVNFLRPAASLQEVSDYPFFNALGLQDPEQTIKAEAHDLTASALTAIIQNYYANKVKQDRNETQEFDILTPGFSVLETYVRGLEQTDFVAQVLAGTTARFADEQVKTNSIATKVKNVAAVASESTMGLAYCVGGKIAENTTISDLSTSVSGKMNTSVVSFASRGASFLGSLASATGGGIVALASTASRKLAPTEFERLIDFKANDITALRGTDSDDKPDQIKRLYLALIGLHVGSMLPDLRVNIVTNKALPSGYEYTYKYTPQVTVETLEMNRLLEYLKLEVNQRNLVIQPVEFAPAHELAKTTIGAKHALNEDIAAAMERLIEQRTANEDTIQKSQAICAKK